jgi:hypothetical protein
MVSSTAVVLAAALWCTISAIAKKPADASDMPPRIRRYPVFTDFKNNTITVGKWSPEAPLYTMAEGALIWPGLDRAPPAAFFVVSNLVKPSEVKAMLDIVRDQVLDHDPDSVDAKPTHEFYLERSGSVGGVRDIEGKVDGRNPAVFAARASARKALARIAGPIASERLLPLINARYYDACRGQCVVCHSLVRQYVDGERTGTTSAPPLGLMVLCCDIRIAT